MALVQTKSQSSGGYVNSYTVAFTSNVTAGSLLVLNLTAGVADTISSITDGRSNTWTSGATTANSETGERKTWMYYVKNAASGATTVTITFTAGMYPDSAVIMREYSGMDTTSPLDQTSTANDGASYVQTHSAGTTGTTTQASELIILGGGCSAAADPVFAAGSGYGNVVQQKGFDLYTYSVMTDKVVSSTGTQTGNFTTTSYVRGQGYIATFKFASSTFGKGVKVAQAVRRASYY